jgi:hypothetical protein
MAIKSTSIKMLKLNVQRSYITLKLPQVTSQIHGGAKCSGQLVTMKGAFDALDKYVQITCKTKTVGEAMNDLLNAFIE